MSQKRRIPKWLGLTAALLMVIVNPLSANAAPVNCNLSHEGTHLWGVRHSFSNGRVSGAQSNLETAVSDLCNPGAGSDESVEAYAALQEVDGPGLALVGWLHSFTLQNKRTFAFYDDGNGHNALEIIGDTANGVVARYKTSWKNNTGEDGQIHMFICASDGTSCVDELQTSFQGSVFADIRGVVTSLATSTDDDLPGTSSAKDDYTQMQFREALGSWQTLTTTVCKVPPSQAGCSDTGAARWNLDRLTDSHMQTWST